MSEKLYPRPDTQPQVHWVILRWLPPGLSAHVLDAGAKEGALSFALKDRGYRVVACDRNPGRFLPESIPLIITSLNRTFPFASEAFDAVISVKELGHLENSDHAAREIARILWPRGRLIVTTPNIPMCTHDFISSSCSWEAVTSSTPCPAPRIQPFTERWGTLTPPDSQSDDMRWSKRALMQLRCSFRTRRHSSEKAESCVPSTASRREEMRAESSGLSVVLITRNEAARIRRCLDSIRWADELIVVDQHSTDATGEICREYGATLILREMRAGFGEQKNFAINRASYPWILCLDADEEVTPALRAAIQNAVANPKGCVGFRIPRLTCYLGRFIRRCGWYPSPVLRLFRRGRGQFTMSLVHEELRVDGPVGILDQDLLHYSYRTLSDHIQKLDLYTGYDARMLASRGIRIQDIRGLWYLLGKPALVFLRKYLWQGGILEGRHGLVLSAMGAFVVFVHYIKLWELTNGQKLLQPGREDPRGAGAV